MSTTTLRSVPFLPPRNEKSLTLQLIVVLVVDKTVGVSLLADVALLMGMLHVEEELVLAKEVFIAEPTNIQGIESGNSHSSFAAGTFTARSNSAQQIRSAQECPAILSSLRR